MTIRLVFLFLVSAVSAVSAPSPTPQLSAPPDVNLFGDDYPHTVYFRDGRVLRGEIVSLSSEEIFLRLPEANAALRIAASDYRRLDFSSMPARSANLNFNRNQAPQSLITTAQLSGRDWLAGELRSLDGETFTLAGKKGASFTFPRSALQWLQVAEEPAPSFFFDAGDPAMKTSGWNGPGIDGDGPLVGGTAETGRTRYGTWIEHEAPKSPRFEVAFDLPEDTEEGSELWLQSNEVNATNLYGGSIALGFGRAALVRRRLPDANGPHEETKPLQDTVQSPGIPVSYRVFYDGLARRLVVFRNAIQIDDWTYTEIAGQTARGNPNSGGVEASYLCFSRHTRNSTELKIDRIHVRPWNGALPSDDAAPTDAESLVAPPDFRAQGKLSAISAQAWTFAGKDYPPSAGMLLLFPHQPSPAEPSECRLVFADTGELDAHELRLEHGRIHFRTSFGQVQEAPLEALESAVFSRRGKIPDSDLLVFKDGDELHGALVAASPGQPLRWRLTCGQEVDIQTDRIAGVRFAVAPTPLRADGPTLLEFCNGDRLRAQLDGLDETQLHLRTRLLGARDLPRNLAWRLSAIADFPTPDEDTQPESWTRETADGEPSGPPQASFLNVGNWRCFDGQCLTWRAPVKNGAHPMLHGQLPAAPAPFEFSFRVTHPSKDDSRPPTFVLSGCGLSFTIYSAEPPLELVGAGPGAQDGTKILLPKAILGSSLDVQLFVDPPAGIARLYLNSFLQMQLHGKFVWEKESSIAVSSSSFDGSPITFSDLHLRPWCGQLSAVPEGKLLIGLANGDVLTGRAHAEAGKITIENESSAVEMPLDRVRSIEFGGLASPVRAPARLHLVDGSLIHIDTYHWDESGLSAHSSMLGDFHLPPAAIRELALDPPLVHFPPHLE